LTTEEEVMLRRRTRWFRRLAAGLAFATLAAPAAAKNDEGGAQAGAGQKVISYLSHGMTAADAQVVNGDFEAMTHRQLEELAASRPIGNGDALTHLQMEELATAQAETFVQGVTDFPKAVEVQAPKVINYLSHGLTAADALDPRTGIPLSAGIPVAGDQYVNADSLGTYGDEPGQVSQAILGELVKSKPQAIVRPDDRADRFTISQAGPERLAASTTDSGFSWNDGVTIGIGALVLVLALALGFGLVRRPKVAV
jgi:hypothetical protein